ncbi:MAG: bifunctional glutamate N-acetyltransferase/amino-acid acetyltransferase ArgJ [Chloroflexi bacterium]|nr:bifunctional glutamate N-acetyltransferase/amino-acid acetyltransferase ArgJ [Chloroflexota bacterium]
MDVPDGTITSPQGFLAGATAARMRDDYAPGRLDLGLLVSERRCAAAGVYTKNTMRGPPIITTERHLADGHAQAVIANSGVSNSLIGEQGMLTAREMAELAAAKLGVAVDDVVVASTGVTGWRLPVERIRDALPAIELSPSGGGDFAHAIMTTDTVAKQAAARFEWQGRAYTVGGAAKGSGMIHPNMATMLAFLTIDAPVSAAALAPLVGEAADATFNMVTIDGDNSPNDMVVLLANGAAGGDEIGAGHPALPALAAAVTHVSAAVARKLARDGEGATKLIEVRVAGAANVDDARRAAKAVAGSLLVKSAIYGNDPNWGRVLVALGYSGVDAREERVALAIQGVELYRAGTPAAFDAAALSRSLAQERVEIRVDLGMGQSSATAWGCDLTEEYVRINAEYTT